MNSCWLPVIADAGSTQYIASMPGAGTCTEKPCLFNLEQDPRGTKFLDYGLPLTTIVCSLHCLSRVFSWLFHRVMTRT